MRRAGSYVSDIIKSTGYAKSTVYLAENDVEVRSKPADVKTGTKAQRES